MARAIVTPERVAAAAEALRVSGEEPSIIAIQERIGGGSYTTIKRHLDAWKEQHAVPTAPDLPPELVTQGTALIERIWATAHGLAAHTANQARQEAEAQVQATQRSLHAAETTIQRLEAAAEESDRQLAALRQEHDELHTSLAEARMATGVAEARAGEQERQLTDLRQQLDRHVEELATLRPLATEHARMSGELEAMRQQLQRQTKLVERLSQKS